MRVSMSAAVMVLARARDDDLGQAASFDIDQLVRQHRVHDALDGDAAGLAEVGCAEDRDVGGGAGVLHEIADAHDSPTMVAAGLREGVVTRCDNGAWAENRSMNGSDPFVPVTCAAAGTVRARSESVTSGPIPKFVSSRGTFRYELRNPRTTSNSIILVPH